MRYASAYLSKNLKGDYRL